MASREPELYKDKIEVSLDGRQIFYLFFGGAVIVGLVFVLGVMIGRRVEARGHLDRADTEAARDPLAALDRLERSDDLSFRRALTGVAAPTDVEKAIGEIEKRRGAGRSDARTERGEPRSDGKLEARAVPEGKDSKSESRTAQGATGSEGNEGKSEMRASPDSKDSKPEGRAQDARSKPESRAETRVAPDGRDSKDSKSDSRAETRVAPDGRDSKDSKSESRAETRAATESRDTRAGKPDSRAETRAAPESRDSKDSKESRAETRAAPDSRDSKDSKPESRAETRAAPDSKDSKESKPESRAETRAAPESKDSKDGKSDSRAETRAAPEGKDSKDGKSEARADGKAGEGKTRFTLQLSSFQDRAEADAFLSSLKSSGFQAYVVEADVNGKGTWYRVRLGSYRSLEAASDAKSEYERSAKKTAQIMRL